MHHTIPHQIFYYILFYYKTLRLIHCLTGKIEYFSDPCEDALNWLDTKSDYSFFKEGWALYAEKPLIADETDTYDGYPLEEYGMLKWQVRLQYRLSIPLESDRSPSP